MLTCLLLYLNFMPAAYALQFGVAKALRAMVVYLLSAAALTSNLPPINIGLMLWQGVAKRFK
jgi:hypothetical protein